MHPLSQDLPLPVQPETGATQVLEAAIRPEARAPMPTDDGGGLLDLVSGVVDFLSFLSDL